MARPRNSIDKFNFISLVRDPGLPKEQIEIIQRPGIDGVLLRKMGKRGVPFQLISRVDVPTISEGRALLNEYAELIGADAVTAFWADSPLSSEGVKVSVLDVQPVRLMAIGASTGGFYSGSQAWLEAVWTLIPIETTAEGEAEE